MTVKTAICVLLIAAPMAYAQSPMSTINDMRRQVNGIGNATEQRRENAAKQLGLKTAPTPAAMTPTKPGQNQVNAVSVKKASAKPGKKGAKVAAAQPAGEQSAEHVQQTSTRARGSKRDPFQTVIRNQPEEQGCGSGKKCLVVSKILLRGIVRSQGGMIAVVENQQKKTYFLRENDPVFNGHVVKISQDSIVFQERVVDRVGRSSLRDVVKRISPSA